jgi:hypothetical protein
VATLSTDNESCEAQNMSETPTFDDFDEADGYKRFGLGAVAFD